MRKLRFPGFEALFGARRERAIEEPPSLVVVGLGNPGSKYAETRHNVGFWSIDRIATEYSIDVSSRNKATVVGEGTIAEQRVVLARPRTFVNRSGEAARYLLARYRIPSDKLLIIYDDINLPLGKLRLRVRGSAGGHNGIKSIIEALGGEEFPRLRIGIGRPSAGQDQISYVIGAMSPEERKVADDMLDRVTQAVSAILTDGIDAAMSGFN
ncbi:MAG: aminoacyl-tRNA hydrolase [Chloroflexi bacterium]|nr:aminoacyl-tRNA hydrolase [Chloroflexota bacterium]